MDITQVTMKGNNMYKILVTSWFYNSLLEAQATVNTVVIEFDSESKAQAALERIHNNNYSSQYLKQSAIALF